VCDGVPHGVALRPGIGQRHSRNSTSIFGEPAAEGVAGAEIVTSFQPVTVGLEEDHVVSVRDQCIDQGTPVAAPTVGDAGWNAQ
jgi:hypothetical protein